MNVVPTEFIRVQAEPLRSFTHQAFVEAGMTAEGAQTMADLLVITDLRGVFSHGTQQTRRYVNLLTAGHVNPRPNVEVVQENPTTAVVDGDGGFGHEPSLLAAKLATEKAKAVGLGAATTRNHNHFGSAGKYSRIASDAGCVGFAASSHIQQLDPKKHNILSASGGSPLSFAFPNGTEPPMVIDMSVNTVSGSEESIRDFPAAVFKTLGLGATCAGLAKIMSGVTAHYESGRSKWQGVGQGAFILAIDIDRFIPLESFKREMDDYVRKARTLQPIPGFDEANFPGNLEWEYEREWRKIGIPIGKEHQASLESVAEDLGLRSPFESE